MELVILGGGIAGLGAAHAARLAGTTATIFEARERAGGLLDSIVVDGFVFDTAAHLSFAREPEVRAVFDQTPSITHAPPVILNWDSLSGGHWLKHPAQNNMAPLPLGDKVALIAGLARNQPPSSIANYREWLIAQYGDAIAHRWPLRYTEKYWTVPAERLGTEWIGQRMRPADLGEVIAGAISQDTPDQYYIHEMRYPQKGGYRAFIEPLIRSSAIECRHRAVRIVPAKRTIAFANGRTVRYASLISTIPLPQLVGMVPDVPPDVREAARSLFATQIDLISVGLRRPAVSPALWFYVYDRDIWAARVYSPDRKSPHNVPDGCSALQFEIYSSPASPQRATVEELKANTIAGLQKMRLATPQDILFVHHTHVPFANVVFDLGMERRRALVRDWVGSQGVLLAGRFGEWEYQWSHQAMLSGMKALREALARRPRRARAVAGR
jgi:protoporphyrinogen oxidase